MRFSWGFWAQRLRSQSRIGAHPPTPGRSLPNRSPNFLDEAGLPAFNPAMNAYLLIAAGAALGGVARFAVAMGVAGLLGKGFPYGTLVVNVTGALAIGILSTQPAKFAEPFWIVGVLGGYTTFSAFSLQSLQLLQEHRLAAAGIYMVGSVGLCLAAVYAGQLLGRGIFKS